MSIMPAGGWGDLGPQDKTDSPRREESVAPAQSGYSRAASYLTCKTCDRGTLIAKKVFRLSGPAVAIGFILLIPSVIGMISCAVALIAVNVGVVSVGVSGTHLPVPPHQSAFEANFRRNCAQSARQRIQGQGYYASPQLIEAYCECALAELKDSGSETVAGETCNEQAQDGTLTPPSPEVEALYSRRTSVEEKSTGGLWYAFMGWADALGSAYLVGLGVAFFVSGLLGWLLVMKKSVLQCDCCRAVVNAS